MLHFSLFFEIMNKFFSCNNYKSSYNNFGICFNVLSSLICFFKLSLSIIAATVHIQQFSNLPSTKSPTPQVWLKTQPPPILGTLETGDQFSYFDWLTANPHYCCLYLQGQGVSFHMMILRYLNKQRNNH